MRRKIKNIFAERDYNSFGGSPSNKIGLHLEFYECGDFVETTWSPSCLYEGYPSAVHGGILASLIEETAAWTIYIKAACAGVSARMNVRYRKPVHSKQKEILTRGKIIKKYRNLYAVFVEILNEEGEVCTEAEMIYFSFSPEKSVREYHFPADYNSFFE